MRHLSLWTLGIIPTRSGAQYQAPEIPGEELRGTARVPRNSRVRASRPGINIYTEGGLYLTNVAPLDMVVGTGSSGQVPCQEIYMGSMRQAEVRVLGRPRRRWTT